MFKTLSGTAVSRFSFGTMQFGGNADASESAAMYACCREKGINFFDTAHGYNDGRSEEITGKLIAGERDDIFIATKCGFNSAAPDEIETQIAESRRRLGVETLDLLYLHRWDRDTPLEASLEVLAGHISIGTVRHVGVSNYAAWQVMKARGVAQSMGFEITALQPMYNLVKRQAEVELLPMAMSEGMAVCPYSPLGGGLLTGKYAAGGQGRLSTDDNYKARYAPDWMRRAAGELMEISAETGVSAATLAVAWVARHPGIWGPIVSARSAVQLMPSLAAIDYDMDDDVYAEITALSPTPAPATDRLEEA